MKDDAIASGSSFIRSAIFYYEYYSEMGGDEATGDRDFNSVEAIVSGGGLYAEL